MGLDIDRMLHEVVRVGASDLHIKVPSVPRMRIEGDLIPVTGATPVTSQEVLAVQQQVMRSELKRQLFANSGAAECSYWTEEARFRVGAFSQRGSTSLVFRVVRDAPSAQTLDLPAAIRGFADSRGGLLLVSGAGGAGKSTTAAAILDAINRSRPCHVVTIEDPIEFLHIDDRALISQREIGRDGTSYPDAVRAALRHDVDVIVVDEVSDEATALAVLRAAEAGRLVVATTQGTGVVETIHRFLDLFSERSVSLAREFFASTLVGVASQRLVPGVDGARRLNAELLVSSPRIRPFVADPNAVGQLEQIMSEDERYGMQTFDQDLLSQLRRGLITEADALSFASHPHRFRGLMARSSMPTGDIERPTNGSFH